MKNFYAFFIAVLVCSLGFGQTTFFTESFESATGYSFPNGSGGSGQDFFNRTDLAGAPAQEVFTYTGFDGSFFIAGEDIDAAITSSLGIVLIENIDITNQNSLQFTAAFASGTDIDIDDANDAMWVEVNIDGGGWIEIGRFEADPSTTSGTGFNGQFAEDTDGDFDGDGTLLNGTFTDFTWAIAGTGSSMDVRISMDLGSGDEEAAFDNVRIAGIAASSNDTDTEVTAPTSGQVTAATITAANATTSGTAFDIIGFDIDDLGTADGLPTNVSRMRFIPGPNNTADWTDFIQGVTLIDGNLNIYTPTLTIEDTQLILDLPVPIPVPDGMSLEFLFGCVFKSTTYC